MLSSEHKVFETSMFGISVVLTLALVIGIGYYISVAFFNHNTVTDEEANASAVSDSAVTVRESPEPTQTPDGNTIVREDDADTQVDEELAKATEGYTTSTVNMRSEPSLTASVVAKVPASTKLTFSGLQKKEWMEVEYNGQKGYINAMYLSVDKPKPIETVTPRPTQKPVRTTATPKATKAPKATKTPKRPNRQRLRRCRKQRKRQVLLLQKHRLRHQQKRQLRHRQKHQLRYRLQSRLLIQQNRLEYCERGNKDHGTVNANDAAVHGNKNEYKDCILFYRLGDFYEMFLMMPYVHTKNLN